MKNLISLFLLLISYTFADCQIITSAARSENGRLAFEGYKDFVFLKAQPGDYDFKIALHDGNLKELAQSSLTGEHLKSLLPRSLSGDWSQVSVLNAPALVREPCIVESSLPPSFVIRLMAQLGGGRIELGEKSVDDEFGYGGKSSDISIFFKANPEASARKLLKFRVADKLFQYIPTEMFVIDENILAITAYGGSPGVNFLTLINLKENRIIGNLSGSQIQYLPYQNAFWVRDTFTRADERVPSFDMLALPSSIIPIYKEKQINSKAFTSEGISLDAP